MKNKMMKILSLADQIIKDEVPRFIGDQDLLEICLTDLRHLAMVASINKETGTVINEIVDSAEILEPKVYDWDMKQRQKEFRAKAQYIALCICEGVMAAQLSTAIKCEACETKKKVA